MMVAFLEKLKGHLPSQADSGHSPSPNPEKTGTNSVTGQSDNADSDHFQDAAQAGIQRIEATTTVWEKKHLILAYGIIWAIYFVTSIEEVLFRSMTPIVTSSFQRHGLTGVTDVVATIVAGLVKLPLAKILDTWGRPQGITMMMVFWVIGLIMMAACNNVQMYAAAMVFAQVGSQGVSYCLTVFIADTSSLRNRALMFAFATSPYIVTTWIGGPAFEDIIRPGGPGWRWGFGIFAIIIPVVVLPLSALFFWAQRKAVKNGITSAKKPKLTPRAIWNYLIEVDLLGILILAAGLALFLLPFSLWTYQADQWRSPMIIAMIIVGGLLIIAFAFYEKYLAPKTFIPFELLTNRSVFFGGLMFTFVFASAGLWGTYLFSHLLVVNARSFKTATYISSIYRVASCGWALLIAVAIRQSGYYKWIALYFAIPLQLLAVGLDILFRQPGQGVGYIIMTQIFIAFAGGSIVICGEIAMLAPVTQDYFAVILAILNLFGSIGSAIGATIATSIWTGTLPEELARNLPADAPIATIYGSIYSQISYPPGSAIRNGINQAYYQTQQYQLIAGVCLLAGAWVCVAIWKNINVNQVKQVKGTVV